MQAPELQLKWEHPVLTKLRLKTMEDPWSGMMVAAEQAQLMANLLRLIKGNKTIEIGMYTGYNTLSMALAVPQDGQVVACEINEDYINTGKPYFQEAGVENKVDIRHQTALKTLDELLEAGEAETYDFVFIDADKKNNENYYEKSLQLIRKGGIIAIDNVLWGGRVINPDKDDVTSQSIDELNKKLHKDQRVDLSMLTVEKESETQVSQLALAIHYLKLRFPHTPPDTVSSARSPLATEALQTVKMLEEKLKKLDCHFTWDLQKEEADLNFLEIKYSENLSVETQHEGNFRQRLLNFLAYIKHLQGFNDKALECLERVKKDSQGIVTYGNLAWLHHHMGNEAKAKLYLEKLSEISGAVPGPVKAELIRGVQSEKAWSLLWFSKKHYSRAKEIFQEALQKEPEDREWNTGYAFSLFHMEGLEIREDKRVPFEESSAVAQLKKAQKLNPDNAMIHVYLGLKCYKNKRNAEAWEHMRKALHMAPYNLNVVLYVAKFMKKEECYDMALEVLQKMLEKAPDSSRLHHEIANNYRWKAKQLQDIHNPQLLRHCVHHLEEGARLNPDFLYPQMELALRYAELKNCGKAEQKFQELFVRPNLKPTDLQAWHRLYGDFNLYRLGSEATAVKHYKEGMALQNISTEWRNCKNRLYKVLHNNRKDVYQIREFMNSLRRGNIVGTEE
ncbi:hypothetical protein AOLI_G00023700 [Acnodon oligacanthus]